MGAGALSHVLARLLFQVFAKILKVHHAPGRGITHIENSIVGDTAFDPVGSHQRNIVSRGVPGHGIELRMARYREESFGIKSPP